MFSNNLNQTASDQARKFLADCHIRTMIHYYILKSLVDASTIDEADAAAVKNTAVECRRFGFRLEAQAEYLDLHLDNYNEDRLRREATRIAQMERTNEREAYAARERLVEEFVSQIIERQGQVLAAAA